MSTVSNTEQDRNSRSGTDLGSIQGSDSLNPPSKRRRVALACSNCRHRKSRCDGRRPRCSLCSELGCECVYEQAGTTTNLTVGRTYIDRLEKRLNDIEATLKQVQESRDPVRRMSSPGNEHRDEAAGEGSIASRPSPLLYQINGGLGEIDTAEDSIDGMGAIKFTDEEDWGYFGPSSNIAFLRHISLAMARAGDLSQAFPSPSNHAREVAGGMSVSRPHPVSDETMTKHLDALHGGVNIYALPTEARTWSLIQEYFQKTGQLLPFVHEETFCATYFEMKRSNFTMARRTWLGLLNIILAMATTLCVEASISAEKRIEESDVYYQRANGLCDKESRRNISLELVQYLLILGQYLQGTQKSVQAWTVHGLAITTAFQLGLHSPKTNKGFPPMECEIRKRVWFGCILLDRMTFGRPSMIPESYLRLELPITNLQVVGQTPQPTPSPQMDAMCYTATIKLYNVMYKIIDSCYGQNLGLDDFRTDSEIISLVFKGEEQLEEWKSQLGPLQMCVYDAPLTPLELEKMELENKITERFVNVLSVRYHNLQILLHRPILEKFLEGCGCPNFTSSKAEAKRGKVQRLGISSVETCVNSAIIVISIVHTIVISDGWRRDLLGAWNYSLFYTFNAGLVIFAAMHVARNEIKTDPKRLSRWEFVEQSLPYFNMAIQALENLDRGNRVVERCVSYLSQLTLLSISPSSLDEIALDHHHLNHHSSTNRNAYANTTAGSNHHQSFARVLNSGMAPRQVPMDIDLNEFMLDTDLDFFSRHFDVGPQY
ncbi:Fc.00g055100.m01.CDS01 [Cosmosporella sp. VM-42]